MKNEEVYPWIALFSADLLFNRGRIFRCMALLAIQIQRQKEEKLQSLDNDCFGC